MRKVTGCLLGSLVALVLWAGDASGAQLPPAWDISDPSHFFPVLPWDPQHGWPPGGVQEKNGLDTIAACHFNMAGFVLPQDLRQCEKLGLGAILFPTDSTFTNHNYFRQWKELSDEQIDNRVKQMVRSAGRSKAVAGFFLCDEPGVREFAGLGKAVAAVKRHAPGRLAYINLFPDYATLGAPDRSQLGTESYTEYLERFVTEVQPQVLSYDNYMVQFSDDFRNHGQAADYFQNLLEVRRVALKHNLPFLQIVSSNQVRPAHPGPSPQNLLLQAYTTLAAGARGVTWYTYYARGYPYGPIGKDGDRTVAWHYLAEVNRQVATLTPILSGLRSTGVYFTSNDYSSALPMLPGKLIRATSANAPLMVGEFEGRQIEPQRQRGTERTQKEAGSGSDRYALIVNISLERTAKVSLTPLSAEARVEQISSENGKGSAFAADKDVLWLTAGQGVLLRFH